MRQLWSIATRRHRRRKNGATSCVMCIAARLYSDQQSENRSGFKPFTHGSADFSKYFVAREVPSSYTPASERERDWNGRTLVQTIVLERSCVRPWLENIMFRKRTRDAPTVISVKSVYIGTRKRDGTIFTLFNAFFFLFENSYWYYIYVDIVVARLSRAVFFFSSFSV